MLTSAPDTVKRNAPARRIGQYDGGGMWMDEVSTCAGGVTLPGGGEGIVHSSVRPSHGSAGAGAPERAVVATFHRKTSSESAIVKAPTVATRFQKFQPRSGA